MPIGDPVTIGAYTITLENIDNSFSGQQTWTYKIELTGNSSGGNEISHWNLELCANHTVLSVSKNGLVVPTADASDLNILLEVPNPNAYCYIGVVPYNIKWDELSNNEVYNPNNPLTPPGTFDLTLQGQYGTRNVELNLKAGNNCVSKTISGPSCVQSRGYDFSKLLDIDFTE